MRVVGIAGRGWRTGRFRAGRPVAGPAVLRFPLLILEKSLDELTELLTNLVRNLRCSLSHHALPLFVLEALELAVCLKQGSSFAIYRVAQLSLNAPLASARK